jgi:hypothetical protein
MTKLLFWKLIAAQGLSILSHFPQDKEASNIRSFQEEQIDFTRPWAFFDGASQNNNSISRRGAFLHLNPNLFFTLKMGLGLGDKQLC